MINESIETLVNQIQKAHQNFAKHRKASLRWALEAGRHLLTVKRQKLYGEHGQWRQWLRKTFPDIKFRQLEKYKRLAANWKQIKEKAKAHPNALLSIDSALRLVTEAKKPLRPALRVVSPSTVEAEEEMVVDQQGEDAVPDSRPRLQIVSPLDSESSEVEEDQTNFLIDDDDIQLFHSDFRELEIADNSVNLIWTDPLYHRKHLSQWDEIGKFAARNLCDNGLLVTYFGMYFLPEVVQALATHLSYELCLYVRCQSPTKHYKGKVVFVRHIKPLLVFSKGGIVPKPQKMFCDCFEGVRVTNKVHPYQQGLEETEYFIERFTDPGDLVCDPFGGSFTTAVACKKLGRRFVGCDWREEYVELGRRRVAECSVPSALEGVLS